MFGQRKQRSEPSDGESREPLLNNSQEDLGQDSRVIFTVDDEDPSETSRLNSPRPDRPDHRVRFQEEVQILGPPLKSTIQSRETGTYAEHFT